MVILPTEENAEVICRYLYAPYTISTRVTFGILSDYFISYVILSPCFSKLTDNIHKCGMI